jgi:hypothetical protein
MELSRGEFVQNLVGIPVGKRDVREQHVGVRYSVNVSYRNSIRKSSVGIGVTTGWSTEGLEF